MNQPNFIIGRGELLTSDVTIQRGMQPPQPIYSFAKAIEKLSPQIVKTGAAIRQLPAAACPSDYAVAKLTLHPAYIAKSYYPASLLRAAELTLMTIAAGNNGEKDQESGNARVQVPGDCVNAIAVGACDKPGKVDWQRAAYSAIGPGRSPGVIKPDLVAFGGSPDHYFHVLTPGSRPIANPTMGTSFAAPYLLRTAVGIRAVMGGDLKPLTLKALMVHCADSMELNRREVGWGKTAEELTEIIMCGDGVARVVYQGILKPGKYLRAVVPVPTGGIQGNVTLSATFCYACPTDPEDSGSYTRAGLEVTFRPNLKVVKEGKKQSATRSFFERKTYADENERRNDYGKWETVLHASDNFRGSTLVAPGFDIHYNARENGGGAGDAGNVKYALIISLHADKHPSIYADILRAYPNILAPITPQVSLPIRV